MMEVKQLAGRIPRLTSGAPSNRLDKGLRLMAKPIAVAVFFSFFTNLLMFVSPLYMLQIYDRVIGSRSETTLISLTVIAGVLLLAYAVLETLRSKLLVRAGLVFDEEMAGFTFSAVHRMSLKSPGLNSVQCLRDVDTLREFLTGAGMLAFCDAPWFPIFVLACFVLHPVFGVIALVASILTLVLATLNEFVTGPALGQASRAASLASVNAQATFRNSEVLQAMGMLGPLRDVWAGYHRGVLSWQFVASDRAGSIVAFSKFLKMFMQTIILGTGAYLVINREISPGQIIAGSIFVGRAMAPIDMAVANWKGFVAARGALRRLRQLFAAAADPSERMALPRPRGSVSAEALVAGAPGGKTAILRGVSFSLVPGDVLGVIGPSAAGKSSLARVLVGVWPLVGGALRLDGSELSHWDPQKLGKYIGYLPQDVELFAGTVSENIARFQRVDEEEVLRAAQLAGCHGMIQHLSDGYDTQIGEGGAALSGGQRQRIGLARAIYGMPSLIVLDEPNANLDSAGEEALLKAVQTLASTGTVVVLITHKLNALAITTKILTLKDGMAQMFGDRDEVLSKVVGPRVVPSAQAPLQPAPAAKISGAE